MVAHGASRERKVRTPQGSVPQKSCGAAWLKLRWMESVTENKPPESQDSGKGEKAG